MTADLVAGTALLPVAAVSLREVKHPRELPFALLPTIFSLHQFIEAVVWAAKDGDRSVGVAHLAVLAYVLIAFALLPTYVPLAVLLLEPKGPGYEWRRSCCSVSSCRRTSPSPSWPIRSACAGFHMR
nr:DUF6629 family protein [Mycobacterium sp. 852002-51613_SCH5001154]